MRFPDPRKIVAPFRNLRSLSGLINSSGQNLIFPFYHAVSDDPPSHLKHLYPVPDPENFSRDLDFLQEHFKALSPEILLKDFHPGTIREPSFILSFDDGLKEVKEWIVPELKRRNLSAIFFLNNQFIGNKALFFRYKASVLVDRIRRGDLSAEIVKKLAESLECKSAGKKKICRELLSFSYDRDHKLDELSEIIGVSFPDYLSNEKPYLGEEDIQELLRDGFYIGGHSLDHPLYSQLTKDEQIRQTLESLDDLQNRFGTDYRFFAFPFTDFGVKDLFQKENGINCDAVFGTAGMKNYKGDQYFQRIPMEKSPCKAEKIIKTEYFYFNLKNLLKL